jgi:glycosyltransferase involved in cell wall biosynthesis
MKILFLLTQDLESPTGLGRYFPLAKYLARLGHQVTIAALHANYAGLHERSFMVDQVQVHYVAQMHVLKQNNQKFYFSNTKLVALAVQATFQLTRAALKFPADIIHIGKPHPMNSIAGMLARLFKNRVLFLDYDDYEAASNRFGSAWQKKIVQLFEDWVPHGSKQITTNNLFLKERLLKHGIPAERIVLLRNGVDAERFLPVYPEALAALRNRLQLENKKIVAFIGSLSMPSHPVDLLLEAYQTVKGAMPDTALLIVGGGEEIHTLQRQANHLGISDTTIFCGYVPSAEISLYYRLADVVIDPVHDDLSARGRLPLKLFESWIAGTPFITSAVGDRQLLLGDPPAGLLVQPGDPMRLADGILRIIQDEAYANLLSERGRQRVKAYEWKKLAKMMEAVYLQALGATN